ncbi:MAG: ABC transporter permease [Planctomycetes bacterium]|nr:ABC transporter permease [Planctomycetota bacterium]
MPLGDLWRLLLETLSTQRLRSFLTILGIVIGIASVVLLSSIGEGTRQAVAGQFTQFGTTVVGIRPGKVRTFGVSPGSLGGTTRPLTVEDGLSLRHIPGIRHVAPHVAGLAEVKAGERTRQVMVYGTVYEDQFVLQWYPRIGTFLPEGDPDLIPAVCVLGSKTARELFPGANPLGAKVRVGLSRFTVVGVMSSKGQLLGFDMDDMAYIPVRRAMKLFNLHQVSEIHLFVTSHSLIDRATREMKRALMDRHGGEEDFTITTNADMLKVVDQVVGALSTGVLVIAAISVFVGAMGILTILWVSVHERRAEVGLLKAIGASDRQVLLIFLAEAAVLSTLGGAIGVAAGLGAGGLLGVVVPGFWIQTPLWIIPLSLGTAAAVGLAAGVVPAGTPFAHPLSSGETLRLHAGIVGETA